MISALKEKILKFLPKVGYYISSDSVYDEKQKAKLSDLLNRDKKDDSDSEEVILIDLDNAEGNPYYTPIVPLSYKVFDSQLYGKAYVFTIPVDDDSLGGGVTNSTFFTKYYKPTKVVFKIKQNDKIIDEIHDIIREKSRTSGKSDHLSVMYGKHTFFIDNMLIIVNYITDTIYIDSLSLDEGSYADNRTDSVLAGLGVVIPGLKYLIIGRARPTGEELVNNDIFGNSTPYLPILQFVQNEGTTSNFLQLLVDGNYISFGMYCMYGGDVVYIPN